MKIIKLLLVITMVSFGIVWFKYPHLLQKPTNPKTVNQDSIKRTQITALGRISPQHKVFELTITNGGRVSELLVEEGDSVKRKQHLGYSDAYLTYQAELKYHESLIQEEQKRMASEISYHQSLVTQARAEVYQIDKDWPVEIAEQKAQIKVLEEDVRYSQHELNRLKNLREQGVSIQDIDKQDYSVRINEKKLQLAETTLQKLEVKYKTSLEVAKSKLEVSQSNLELIKNSSKVLSLQKNLEYAKARADSSIMFAPVDGKILKIVARPGEKVTNGSVILQMGHVDKMYAIAEVYESDVSLVKIGQRATITSYALPEEVVGTVERIGHIIYKNDVLDVDPASDIDARVVEVEILLENSELLQRLSNLQVNVAIHLENR